MPHLENVENDVEDDNESDSSESFTSSGISSDKEYLRIPGSKTRPNYSSYKRPERIDVRNTSGTTPKRRGRPPGKTKSTTSIESWWIDGAALILHFSSILIIAKPFAKKEYIMTKAEAQSAAQAIMTVAVKYKQVRDVMAVVNLESDWGIIAKGFAPYIMRAFLKDVIEDVISGLFVSRPKQQKSAGTAGNGQSPVGNVNGNSKRENTKSAEQPVGPAINIASDWRDV